MSYKPSYVDQWKEYFMDWFKYFGFFFKPQMYLNSENSLVLVLDAIESYRNLFNNTNIQSINTLISNAELYSVPIVYTNWIRTKNLLDDQINKIGHWSEFISNESTILKELPQNKRTMYTIYTDAFANTWDKEKKTMKRNELINFIGNRKNIIICGSWTEACVLTTARSAAMKDLNPIILKPATVGHGKASKNSFILIDKLYGHVTNDVSFL